MTILTREQIDGIARADGRVHPDIIATARAYHDLRDAVLALHFDDHGVCPVCVDDMLEPLPAPCPTAQAVARVDGGA